MADLPIGILTTGREIETLHLLQIIYGEELSGARIAWVGMNRARGKPHYGNPADKIGEWAEQKGLPTYHFDSSALVDRLAEEKGGSRFLADIDPRHDAALISNLIEPAFEEEPVKYVLLMRAMHIWGQDGLEKLASMGITLLNLHHAPPYGPRYAMKDVFYAHIAMRYAPQLVDDIGKGIVERTSDAGTMIHVTHPTLDRGRCVAYFKFPMWLSDGEARIDVPDAFEPYWKRIEEIFQGAKDPALAMDQVKANGTVDDFLQKWSAKQYAHEKPFVAEVLRELASKEIALDGVGMDAVPFFSPAMPDDLRDERTWGRNLSDIAFRRTNQPNPYALKIDGKVPQVASSNGSFI